MSKQTPILLIPDRVILAALKMGLGNFSSGDYRRNRVALGLEKSHFTGLSVYEDLIELSEDKELTELVTKGMYNKDLDYEKKRFNNDAFYILLLRKRLGIVDWENEQHKQTTTYKYISERLESHPNWEFRQKYLIKNTLSLPRFKNSEKIYAQDFLSTLTAHMIDFSALPKPDFLNLNSTYFDLT